MEKKQEIIDKDVHMHPLGAGFAHKDNKATHYEEASDFNEVIDWDMVWNMHPLSRSAVLRGKKKPPMKKVKKNA